MRLLDGEGYCRVCKAHYFEHSIEDVNECVSIMREVEMRPSLEDVVSAPGYIPTLDEMADAYRRGG